MITTRIELNTYFIVLNFRELRFVWFYGRFAERLYGLFLKNKMIIRILVLFNPQDLEISPIVCTFAEKINIV